MGDIIIEIEELDLPLIDKTIYDIKAYVVFDREAEIIWYLDAIVWDGNTLEWDGATTLRSNDLSKMIWDRVNAYIEPEAFLAAHDHFLDEEHDY